LGFTWLVYLFYNIAGFVFFGLSYKYDKKA